MRLLLAAFLALSLSALADLRAITVGGKKRSYDLHLPKGRAPSEPAALVLVFHGGAGTADKAKRMSSMELKSDREGFIAVFPNGTGLLPDATRALTWNAWWCCGAAIQNQVDDVAFVRALVEDIARDYRIDRKRIYAAGLSNGGMFAYRLGCEAGDLVAAIAPVAGALNSEECESGPKVSVIAFHGTADRHVPFEGGPPPSPYDRHPRQDKSVQFAMDVWKKRNACSFKPDQERQGSVVHLSYRCPDGIGLELYAIQGQGHAWPGGKKGVRFGNVDDPTAEISATDVMWEFFKAHPKP